MGGESASLDGDAVANLTDEQKEEIYELRFITKMILSYFPILLVLAGIPSNIFIIHIINSSSLLRNNFVSVFLMYLSLFNIINIVLGLSRLWFIGMFNFDIRHISMFISRFHSFVTMVAHMVSNWILCFLSMCKMLYVFSPYIAFECCTKYIVHVLVFIIILASILFNFVITEGGKRVAMVSQVEKDVEEDMIAYSRTRAIIQASVFFYIPDGTVHLLNLSIVILYTRTLKLDTTASETFKRHLQTSRRYAIVTLLIDLQFSIMEVPYAIYFTEKMDFESIDPQKQAKANLLHVVATMMLYSNYCTNFLMYCVFGRYYRNQLKRMVHPCVKHCLDKDSDWLTVSSSASTVTESDYEVPSDIAGRRSLHAAGSLKELYQTRPGMLRMSRSMSRSGSRVSRFLSTSAANENIEGHPEWSWLPNFVRSVPVNKSIDKRPSTFIY